jgi:hypothetical protein
MSSVMEFPPLLTGGFCDIAESDFERLFVMPFNSTTREGLCAKFREWLGAIKAIPVPLEIWIDGSFVTYKPNPRDIDILCIYDKDDADALGSEYAERLDWLLWIGSVKATYGCHVIPMQRGLVDLYNYWFKMFGYNRSGESKGIFRIFTGVEA